MGAEFNAYFELCQISKYIVLVKIIYRFSLLKQGSTCNFATVMDRKYKNTNVKLFENWSFTSKNYLLFGIGLFIIIFGYIIMATGTVNSFQSLTIAPIMLFIGYIIIIPLALIYKEKTDTSSSDK